MNRLQLMKRSLTNPLDFFYEYQFMKRPKVTDALFIVLFAFCTKLLYLIYSGFSFRYLEAYEVSLIFEAVWFFVPWLTWGVANWAVSAIMEGEGKFIDIMTGSAYMYVPYILILLPLTFLSNMLTLKELSIYQFIYSFMSLWMIFILLVQVKVFHDFELGKTIWTSILSGLGMLLIWFICIMIFGLVNQTVQFFLNILKEISYRS